MFQVAITIYWLGKSVRSWFDGPQLDLSAFTELVGHCGCAAYQSPRPRSSISSPCQSPYQAPPAAVPITSSLPFGAVPSKDNTPANWEVEELDIGAIEQEQDLEDEKAHYVLDRKTGLVHKLSSESANTSGYSSVRSSHYSDITSPKLCPDEEPEGAVGMMKYTSDSDQNKPPGNMYEYRRSSLYGQQHNTSSDSSSTYDSKMDNSAGDDHYNKFRYGSPDGTGPNSPRQTSSSSAEFIPPTRVPERRTSAAPAYDPLQFVKGSRSTNPLVETAKKTIDVMQEQKKVKAVSEMDAAEDWQSVRVYVVSFSLFYSLSYLLLICGILPYNNANIF